LKVLGRLGPEGELGRLSCAEGKREREKPGRLGWAALEKKRGRREKKEEEKERDLDRAKREKRGREKEKKG
jgi:hypothetical protein